MIFKITKNKTYAIASLALLLLTTGCATKVKVPENTQNPAPSEAFSNFSRFEVKPINQGPGCDKQRGADNALDAIQQKLDNRLGGLIAAWNTAAPAKAKERKLIIEPVCSNAKLISPAARILGGAFVGSSAVVLNVRYTDASSGKVIAEPVFYQHANMMGSGYSFGATDRDMLDRIASMITTYTSKNYDNAVGGPTGLEIKN
ncbi:hypothetical protein [Herminiimonas aquatilis]|uniref:DUF4410 domain-containing protein n=1 Tax=Herminiimonas aquatilis TaxID=345342 RepID=A0ABW2J1D8_9BURK